MDQRLSLMSRLVGRAPPALKAILLATASAADWLESGAKPVLFVAMPTPAPYVSRPQAEDFLAALAESFKQPAQSPAVFHVWGIGGVGKSTLTRRATEAHQKMTRIASVSFGLTEGIDEPILLMAKLYEQIVPKNSWNDPFWGRYELYFETIHQLKTQPATGRGSVDEEQVNQVKQLLKLGADVVGLALSEPAKKGVVTVVDRGVDAAVAGLSLKDELQKLLQDHRATKRDQALQRLMLDPLPQLTTVFAAGLAQQAAQQPVLLVLDTYEKVPAPIDGWLWRTLLANTDLASHAVRLMVAGRRCLLKEEGWRKLQQDRQLVSDLTIERFDLAQTRDYLRQVDITDTDKTEAIYRVTKGLPYYLNWIREQQAKGRELDFAQGNQEIVRLLLQGLNDTQKRVVQLAACCRWFDRQVIQYLVEQQGLDFATAVDEERNCFGWLVQLSFVEPVKARFRLDDVARDVFRASLYQADREQFEQVNDWLTAYFKRRSDREVPPEGAPPAKYRNPDWRELRAEFLYYLLFTRQSEVQTQFISHLLEARYFRQDELVQLPYQAVLAEGDLQNNELLSYSTKQLLQKIGPAVMYGWAVLEEDSIDHSANQRKLGLSQRNTEQAIAICLGNSETLQGLAKFVALFYKHRRCPKEQQFDWLLKAQAQAEQIACFEEPEFSSGLFLWNIGNASSDLGRYEEAIAAYEQALSIKPDDHAALNNKGMALYALGCKKEAIAFYEQALSIKPDDHAALYAKGLALSALGRYEEAIAAYEQALSIKPDYHKALNNKGNALSNLGRKEEAIACYEQALSIKPDKHEALNNKGAALSALGRKEEAIACYEQALSINPDYHEALYNKGLALSALGRKEEAIAAYEQALSIKPDDHEALNNKGNALDDLGRKEEAIAAYEQALSIKPDYASALYNKACCYGLQKETELALEFLSRAIELDSEYREMAKTDSDFDAIRDDEQFQKLLKGN